MPWLKNGTKMRGCVPQCKCCRFFIALLRQILRGSQQWVCITPDTLLCLILLTLSSVSARRVPGRCRFFVLVGWSDLVQNSSPGCVVRFSAGEMFKHSRSDSIYGHAIQRPTMNEWLRCLSFFAGSDCLNWRRNSAQWLDTQPSNSVITLPLASIPVWWHYSTALFLGYCICPKFSYHGLLFRSSCSKPGTDANNLISISFLWLKTCGVQGIISAG